MHRDTVRTAVFNAIVKMNEHLPGDQQIHADEATPLTGDRAAVDSLGLINLIVGIEQAVEDAFAQPVVLTNDDALFQEPGPLRTVGTLVDFLAEMLNE